MSTPHAYIDLSQLKTLTGGDNAFLIEVLELIERQSPSALAQMHASYQTGDYQTLKAAAHKYKSSVNFLGNAELVGLIKQIEHQAGLPGQNEELRQLLTQLQAIYDELLLHIEQELSRLKTES
jgi:HPt (histidine-containing phosphotransfer) domain-containing protein